MDSYNLYTKTKILKLFFMVAVPGSIGMIASSLWGLFDGILVGNYLGEEAFAAVNLAFPFIAINFSLADLIGVGASVPISIALGQNQEDKAKNYFTCACITIIAVGIISGIILYALAPVFFSVMGAEGELKRQAMLYLRIYAIFSPLTNIVFAMDNFLRICGKIKSSMFINILMSIFILVLEFFCFAGLNMGIEGSPIAVSLGMIICAVIMLYPFAAKKLVLSFCKPKFSLDIIKRFVISGGPNFLSNTAAKLTSIIMNIVLLDMGGSQAVSIYGILMYIGDIVQQLLYGACDSLQPAIGYNWGAENKARVKGLVKCCFGASAVISFLGVAVMVIFPEEIVTMFLKDSQGGLLAASVSALWLYSLTYLTRWLPFTVQSFMIAVNKVSPATVLSVANTFVLPLILLVLLYPLGLEGIWLNTSVTSALVTVLAVVFLVRMKKKDGLRNK